MYWIFVMLYRLDIVDIDRYTSSKYSKCIDVRDIMLRTDPVVCPDCNIEDSLSSNMRREIAENTAYTHCFLLSDLEFSGFRV